METTARAQHTAGPWAIEYDGPSLPIITAGPKHEIIALVRGLNAEADAPLMKAAPALLAALEELIQTIDPDPEHKPHLTLEPYFERPITQARAAIAQARGDA